MYRTKGILIAASLTALVLVTILALGFGKVIANSNDAAGGASSAAKLNPSGTGQGDLQQQLNAWQKYSQELEQTVRIMQQRETQYQQKLESANQKIVQLQQTINSGSFLQARPFYEEREGNELGEFDD